MPDPTFRGDPYRELELPRDASSAQLKRRWRELARQHHPDRAAGNREEADRLTRRMARINAAYDILRDPLRRARYDDSAAGRRAGGRTRDGRRTYETEQSAAPSGPPPPPVTRPVTARFDTSSAFRPRNTTLSEDLGFGAVPTAGARGVRDSRGARGAFNARPAPRARREESELRASTPSGPVERQTTRAQPAPSLDEAREAVLEFGKHRGYTLGEVELLEPTYIDWIAQTITRDRDLVQKARVIQSEMDRQGVSRRARQGASGFGSRASTFDNRAASG
ncbi:MAG TPA: DnaJ domain-containing protein [Candidatus Limnocylindria bacterium]|nr:DnaJ domain-containing protein [Candidatus Limnocylindria bacterium]